MLGSTVGDVHALGRDATVGRAQEVGVDSHLFVQTQRDERRLLLAAPAVERLQPVLGGEPALERRLFLRENDPGRGVDALSIVIGAGETRRKADGLIDIFRRPERLARPLPVHRSLPGSGPDLLSDQGEGWEREGKRKGASTTFHFFRLLRGSVVSRKRRPFGPPGIDPHSEARRPADRRNRGRGQPTCAAVLLRHATPSVFHQRHAGRVLRSSRNCRGRRPASSRSREFSKRESGKGLLVGGLKLPLARGRWRCGMSREVSRRASASSR